MGAERQLQRERGPLAWLTLDLDLPAVRLDDATNQGQAKSPSPARRRRGAAERLEEMLRVLGSYRRSVVVDGERCVARFRDSHRDEHRGVGRSVLHGIRREVPDGATNVIRAPCADYVVRDLDDEPLPVLGSKLFCGLLRERAET